MKLFGGLNQNLKQRVLELDKPTFDFADKEVGRVSNRTKQLTATVPVTQLESLALSQRIIASNVKHRSMKVINSMTNFLADMNKQKRLTEQILLQKNSAENSTISVPVVISETNFDKFDNKNVEVVVSKVQLSQQTQTAVKNAVNQDVESLQWQNEREISKEIKSEFSKFLSNSGSSQRVIDMANKLFMANSFQTIKNEVL
jgi:hypothetical protein